MNLKGRDIISLNSLNKKEIEYLLSRAQHYERIEKRGGCADLKGRVLATLFYEPTTRTRLSFESAMHRLGGSVLGFSGTEGTSVMKGESLADTIRTVESYSDIIVMRHPVEGSAELAAKVASVPIINGGDGAHSHPTQTLLDLYTIKREKTKFKNLKVALVGDLKYGRTVHTLSGALAMFGADMVFVSPDQLKMPHDFTSKLENEFKISIKEEASLENVIRDIDVLYMTRIQKERFPDPEEYEKVKGAFRVDVKLLENAKKSLTVMHPLPRVYEIHTDVDATPYAKYFSQAYYGVPMRMAIIASVMGVKK